MLEMRGFLADHMMLHIVAMNIVAPLLAVALASLSLRLRKLQLGDHVGLAGLCQLAILWLWHAPPAFHLAMTMPFGAYLMQLSLFGTALWFWLAVVDAADRSAWRALGALLIAGKLFCLLGVLLAFAPRPLYVAPMMHSGGLSTPELLADQQLAGLLMLIACPLTFILAGIIVAARWVKRLDRAPAWTGRDETII